jgi:hypothetical protein
MIRLSFVVIGALLALGGGTAWAACNPVKSEVVSLGEKAARFYSERSLQEAIATEKGRLATVGASIGPVTKSMDCKPFPNLVGADEWRCVGTGKVCAK